MVYLGDYCEIGDGDQGEAGTFNSSGTVTRNFPVTAASTGGSQGLQKFGVVPANAEFALQYAHDSLPATGGTIRCYGESTWTISAFVNITKPNVTIEFNGVVMRANSGMSRAFQIAAQNFRAYRPKFVQTGATSASFAFFLFTQGATDYLCNGAGIYHGEWDVTCTTAAQRIYAIQAIGSGSAKGMHGLTVEGCRFSPQTASTVQTNSQTSNSPWGFIPIRADHVEHIHIRANTFIGDCVAGSIPAGHIGPCMWLSSTRFAEISGNTFSYLDTSAADDTKAWLLLVDEASGFSEGHHFTYVGNVNELCAIDTVVRLRGANFCVFAGNNFGRSANNAITHPTGAQPRGILKSEGGASYPGTSITFAGNSIHNSGSTSPFILDGTRGLLVVGNDFQLTDPNIPLVDASNGATYDADPSVNPITRQTSG